MPNDELDLNTLGIADLLRRMENGGLTAKARASLGLPEAEVFRKPAQPVGGGRGFTLAQTIVGRASGLPALLRARHHWR